MDCDCIHRHQNENSQMAESDFLGRTWMLTKNHKSVRLHIALAGIMISGLLAAIPGLAWNTFLGGTGSDESADIAVDANGNVYITGFSEFTWGSPLNALAGDYDAYVAKLNSNGVREWHTFVGGTAWDFAEDIALDGSGNIYITGVSQGTWGTPIRAFEGWADVFVAKYNTNGALQWSTFLGGGGYDSGFGIALDGDGNVYVTGYSNGWGTPINPHGGSAEDAFVAKLNNNGILQWHTFLGGTGLDEGFAIDVTATGDIFVTGESDATWGTPVAAHHGNDDAFVARLNNAGTRQWHTFLGGQYAERGTGIGVDGNGNVYVAGFSWWGWGTPINAHGGGLVDAFVAKLNGNGSSQWHTFLGGTEDDTAWDLSVDNSGSIYVTGYSGATWGTPFRSFAGYYDAFVAKFNGSGLRLWHTFLGGPGDDDGNGITVSNGKFYVAGYSGTTWGNPIVAYVDVTDGFVAKSDFDPPIFSDVPSDHWARSYVERLFNAGITGGCNASPLMYCPENIVTRAQMAIFLERGINGSSYAPPAVGGGTGFTDVPSNHWAAAWIKQFALDGITAGCGTGTFCPEGPVTRAQMAVFLLKARHGVSYTPPTVGTGTGFADVPFNYWSAAWIKQLAAEGITGGCGGGNYCPEAPVTRAQMAVFLVKTFGLP